jgi:hypothetical protein
MITKITILLIFISLLYLTLTSCAKPPVSPPPRAKPPVSPPPRAKPPVRDWFREKYLKELYDHQFTYIYETDYKDRVTCPEIHKPAVMSALSGTTFLHKHRVRAKMPPPVKYWKPPRHPEPYAYILDITIRDILVYLSKFLPYISTSVYYIWQVFIVVLYLVLTIPMTVMVLVLFFGQY